MRASIVLILGVLIGCGGGGGTAPLDDRTYPDGITAEMVSAGERIYASVSCIRCHGARGRNGPYCPDLTDGTWLHGGKDIANLIRIITDGMPADSFKQATSQAEFAMNPRGGQSLTDSQIRNLAAYVWSLSP